MFLPESMYFFMLGFVLLAVLKAAEHYTWQNWAVVGLLVGTASLVKPHAWLSAIAIGIFMVVLGLSNKQLRYKPLLLSVGAILAGAVLGRLVVGLLVGGPKALGFFGAYFTADTVSQLTDSTTVESGIESGLVGAGPLAGALGQFGIHLTTHALTASALIGIAVVGLLVGAVELIKTRKLTPVTALTLFALIWLVSMMVEIVLFTGWITGGGDDHTTRVLLRYYDFLFVIVPLAGLAAMAKGLTSEVNVFIRWALVFIIGLLITPAFSGYFGTLTIQIADAPNLAGLVVNQDVLNGVALT
jgi:hypothetical protein